MGVNLIRGGGAKHCELDKLIRKYQKKKTAGNQGCVLLAYKERNVLLEKIYCKDPESTLIRFMMIKSWAARDTTVVPLMLLLRLWL